MEKITVVIVDDHPIFRQGVVDSLSLEPDIKVIGAAADGEAGLELIREVIPEVAVVDVNLPEMNGQQVTRQVVTDKLPTRMILLTGYDDLEQKLLAMRVGAAAYCVKDVQPERLVNVVREVAAGKYVVGDRVFDRSELERWLEPTTEEARQPFDNLEESLQPLSGREMEVLTHLTHGMSNKEIATHLGISHQTVKNHVTAILRKLGVEDRTQAALYALRRGWVRLHEQSAEHEE
ncbi:MAG TPA: response regulator transcription factor [Anaerolineales bacterium]